jgi:hypothetical protein
MLDNFFLSQLSLIDVPEKLNLEVGKQLFVWEKHTIDSD